MKSNKIFVTLGTTFMALSLVGCGGNNPKPISIKFSFTASLASDKTILEVGDTDYITIQTNGAEKFVEREYEYTVDNGAVLTVDEDGNVEAVGEGKARCTVKEINSNVKDVINITVNSKSEKASGGYNYASSSGAQAIQTRTQILGQLEKYAVDNHLTGITLFENGGYVKYNPRIQMPTTNYITGYGFGILSEGDITEKGSIQEENPDHALYYHSAYSQDPSTINAMNDTGSQVSDLSSYITSSYWSTKMNANKDGYEWYPVLAKDKLKNGDVNQYPLPVDKSGKAQFEDGFEANPLGLYKSWRIYVKTGAKDGLKYRTMSQSRKAFDNREVALEDYAFSYQILLTGANNQTRGAEMASDTSYGIKGAQSYYNKTKEMKDQEAIDAVWESMVKNGSLGIKTGEDTYGGEYIELTIVNPIDDFTAMYTLSSSLVSPLPRAFFETIGTNGSIIDAITNKYGTFANSTADNAIVDYTLCLGAYTLESWKKRQMICFKQNDTWFERTTYPNRYKIKGVAMRYIDTSQNSEAIYNQFNQGLVDAAGIPINFITVEASRPNVYKTKGDSTFKLNVNSCNQERWNELFGPNGTISPNSSWTLKPWMANGDFLNGLFYSINRSEFAAKRGVQPSINYFSDAYLSDPQEGISYNDTPEHKAAIADYHKVVGGQDNYGYDIDKAIEYFKKAVNTLVANGDLEFGADSNHPKTIEIHIRWMYETDIKEYGNDIGKYFETAFNNPAVSGGRIKLVVKQDAVTNWSDVYNVWMMKGQFDLAFGAISGNTYNPLNFLEVLKSDNSSGFTLNWGDDTSKVNENNPLVYDGKKWSFDALWEVSDHGGVVDNGEAVKSIKSTYCELPSKDGKATNELYNGFEISIPVEFVDVNDVSFSVDELNLYVAGYGNFDFQEGGSWDYDEDKGKIKFTLSKEKAEELNELIKTTNKLDKQLDNGGLTPAQEENCKHPFKWSTYNVYWAFELAYSISIKGGDPSQTFKSIAKTKAEADAEK